MDATGTDTMAREPWIMDEKRAETRRNSVRPNVIPQKAHASPSEHFFTHPVMLSRAEPADLFQVPYTTNDEERVAWFSTAQAISCQNRLETFTAESLNALSEAVFETGNSRYFLMNDIAIDPVELDKLSHPHLALSYNSNWLLDISAEHFGLSKKNQKNYAYRYKKLIKALGREPEFVFRKASADDFNLVHEFAEARLVAMGGKLYGGEAKRREEEAITREIGYFAGCFDDGKFISGNIMYVTNNRAYGILTAMNPDYYAFSPGLVAHKFTMQSLYDMGVREVNLMWGDNPYKKSLGARQQCLYTIALARSHLQLVRPSLLRAIAPHFNRFARWRIKKLYKQFSGTSR